MFKKGLSKINQKFLKKTGLGGLRGWTARASGPFVQVDPLREKRWGGLFRWIGERLRGWTVRAGGLFARVDHLLGRTVRVVLEGLE